MNPRELSPGDRVLLHCEMAPEGRKERLAQFFAICESRAAFLMAAFGPTRFIMVFDLGQDGVLTDADGWTVSVSKLGRMAHG